MARLEKLSFEVFREQHDMRFAAIERSIIELLRDNPNGVERYGIDVKLFPNRTDYSIHDYMNMQTAVQRLISRKEIIVVTKTEIVQDNFGDLMIKTDYYQLAKQVNQVTIIEE